MPILGGFGNASEYAYRPPIIEIPDPFDWVNLYNIEPGVEYRAGYAKITGIKTILPVKVSIGSSYSLVSNVFDNGQTVTFDNNDINQASFDEYSDPNNRFNPGLGFNTVNTTIKNNQSINLSLFAPKTTKIDFNKTYTTIVSLGKTTQDWIVQTRPIDETPNTFSFVAIASTTTSTQIESNEITISGLESGFTFSSQIISGTGSILVDGIDRGSSYNVSNGNKIKLKTTTSSTFNSSTNISLLVGTFSTTWSIKTEVENLNIVFTPLDFNDLNFVQLNTNYESNQITISGLSSNSDLPVTLSNVNSSYEVERGGTIIKNFVDAPIEVINNDKIRLRILSSSSYSSLVSTTMQIGNTSADWKVTTRNAP